MVSSTYSLRVKALYLTVHSLWALLNSLNAAAIMSEKAFRNPLKLLNLLWWIAILMHRHIEEWNILRMFRTRS